MRNFLMLTLITSLLSACSFDNREPGSAPVASARAMPDIFQPMTPSQQRAVMSGERPDWTEVSPPKIPHR